MMFCRAFESLPDQTLAEYFGTALYGRYAGTGLNVLSPLLQLADRFSLESSRAQHRSRLSGSLDPEVASWPAVRGKMIAKERQDALATSKTLPASITAYGRLIQEQLQAQGVQHYSLDALVSKSRLQTEYFHLGYQFTNAFGESDNFHTLPFGSLKAKVCVVLDNRHIDIGTKTSDSGGFLGSFVLLDFMKTTLSCSPTITRTVGCTTPSRVPKTRIILRDVENSRGS